MNSFTAFTGQSLKNIIKVGSIFPSSSFLAKRMIKGIKSPIILELGPGTGVFTKEILKNLPEDGRLISIESNDIFASHLRDQIKDKRLKVITGDAAMLNLFLKEEGIDKVGCVISGLPLGNFKKETNHEILREVFKCLEDGGSFIQFEYILSAIRSVKKFFPAISISYEILNLPPAFVMRCKKNKK